MIYTYKIQYYNSKKTVPKLRHAQGADIVAVMLVKNHLFAVEVAVCVPAHVVVCL
jgi:hypothetical protein